MPDSLQIVRSKFPKVKEVVDAIRAVRVVVTEKNAKTGKRLDHFGCPMVHACENLEGVDGAIVSTRAAYLIKGTKAVRYSVGARVMREITSMDRGAGFAPGEYLLQKPHNHTPAGRGHGHSKGFSKDTAPRVRYDHVQGARAPLATFLPAPKRKGKAKAH